MGEIARHNCDPDGQGLVQVLCVYLRYGGAETSPCFVDQTATDLAFIFEGSGVRDVEGSFCGLCVHGVSLRRFFEACIWILRSAGRT